MNRLIIFLFLSIFNCSYAQTINKLEQNGGLYFSSGFYDDTLSVYLNEETLIENLPIKTVTNLGCVPIEFVFFFSVNQFFIQFTPEKIYQMSINKAKGTFLNVKINGMVLTINPKKNKYFIIKKTDAEFQIEESNLEPNFN